MGKFVMKDALDIISDSWKSGTIKILLTERCQCLSVELGDGQTSSPASPFLAGGDMAVGTVCDVTWPSARHST
jgi:hypothetical protein